MCKTRFNCWGMILNGFNPSLMTGILIMYTSGTVAGGSKLSILLVRMCLSCRYPPHSMNCDNAWYSEVGNRKLFGIGEILTLTFKTLLSRIFKSI